MGPRRCAAEQASLTRQAGTARATPAWRSALRRLVGVGSLAVFIAAGTPASARADEVIDRVLAVASGEVITLSDVRAARELGRVDVSSAADPIRTILSVLIDRALVLAEVNRFAPPEPSPDMIDSAVDVVVAHFASPEAFDAVLSQLGVDRAYVRGLLREDLRIRAYLEQRFTAATTDEQRRLIDDWVAGLRRRAEVVDLYGAGATARTPDTGAPGRD